MTDIPDADLPHKPFPLFGVGMTSLVLGVIGSILFFLPILGIPISAFGVAFGIVGVVTGLLSRDASLRFSLAGLCASALALGTNVAITFAPPGYLPARPGQPLWNPVRDRPVVPPPATREQGPPQARRGDAGKNGVTKLTTVPSSRLAFFAGDPLHERPSHLAAALARCVPDCSRLGISAAGRRADAHKNRRI